MIQIALLDLYDTLENASKCYKLVASSLSAPEIGYDIPVIITKLNDEYSFFIDPKIIQRKDYKKLFYIDCLCLNTQRALKQYYSDITVEYFDNNLKPKVGRFNGELSAVIQYQVNNLNGISLIDTFNKDCLFIPRERKYANNKVHPNNWGLIVAIRIMLKIIKPTPFVQYYSMLLSDCYDFSGYVQSSANKRSELVRLIRKYAITQSKIIEAGCGTSAISVYLSRIGYDVIGVDIDDNILGIAQNVNQKANGNARYTNQNICNFSYQNDSFDILFSHGVLEHFTPQETYRAVLEGLRIAKICIISIPTIWDRSNSLLGNENLWTIRKWRQLFRKWGCNILEEVRAYVGNKRPCGNVIFVLSRGN